MPKSRTVEVQRRVEEAARLVAELGAATAAQVAEALGISYGQAYYALRLAERAGLVKGVYLRGGLEAWIPSGAAAGAEAVLKLSMDSASAEEVVRAACDAVRRLRSRWVCLKSRALAKAVGRRSAARIAAAVLSALLGPPTHETASGGLHWCGEREALEAALCRQAN